MSTCGLVMACGRPKGHRGQHAGFRTPDAFWAVLLLLVAKR